MYSHQNHLRFRQHLMAIRFPELLHFRFRFPDFFGHFRFPEFRPFRFPEFRQLRFPFPVLLPVYPRSIFFRQNNLGEKDKRHTRWGYFFREKSNKLQVNKHIPITNILIQCNSCTGWLTSESSFCLPFYRRIRKKTSLKLYCCLNNLSSVLIKSWTRGTFKIINL